MHLVQVCMTCGMCVVADVLSFIAHSFFLVVFAGFVTDDDFLDPVVIEHYDALGYDLSFRGWD